MIAAAYACGIARHHPFLDGNKRVALLAAEAFPVDHGLTLDAGDAEIDRVVTKLADGSIGETALATWIRERIERA